MTQDFKARAKQKQQQLESAKASHSLHAVRCKNEQCPDFKSCPQVGSHFRQFGNSDQAQVFYLFDSPSPSEVSNGGIPATSKSGFIFRDQILPKIVKSAPVSYLISYLVKSPVSEEDEGKLDKTVIDECWSHLAKDLQKHRPRVVVAFGINTFTMLLARALNRHELPSSSEIQMSNLRSKVLKIKLFEDYTTELLVCYSPGFILSNPSASKFLIEDTHRIQSLVSGVPSTIGRFASTVNVEEIKILRTVDEALQFLDDLTNGVILTEPTPVAFDTETKGLNRKFNNHFLTWQFSYREGCAVVIPIEHPELPLFEDIENKIKLIEAAQKLFNAPTEISNIECFVAHNSKFDLSVMYGLLDILPRSPIAPYWWCTQSAMHWLDENRKGLAQYMDAGDKPYSLKTLGKEFFGFRYKSEHLERRQEADLGSLTIEEIAEYGGSDAILTRALRVKQLELADLQPDNARERLQRFVQYYFDRANRALAVMECNGLYVHPEHIRFMQGENSPIRNRIHQIRYVELQEAPEVLEFRTLYSDKLSSKTKIEYEDLWDDMPVENNLIEFDPSQKKHKGYFYVDYLDLEPLEISNKTGDPSFDKGFLEHYSARGSFLQSTAKKFSEYYTEIIGTTDKGEAVYRSNSLQLILELTGLEKLANTYLNGMEKLLDDPFGDSLDGRIRPSFHPTGTDTGRLSSSNPNFQNLPAGKNKAAKEVKNIFQAEPPSRKWPNGTLLIQVDYAAAEVFWAVNFSGETNLIPFLLDCERKLEEAYRNGNFLSDEEFDAVILSTDFHKRTASLMFEIDPSKVTKSMRQDSKSITFGLLYGKTVQGLAADNGWTLQEAEAKMKKFFSAFPRLEKWLLKQQETAATRGYVETFMGRRRRLAHFYATKEYKHIGDANRRSMNAPIQGQSSDGGVLGLSNFLDYTLEHDLEKRWLIQNVVHDSVLFQVPTEDIYEVLPIIKKALTKDMISYIQDKWGVKIPVTLRCDFEIGLRYGDLHNWDQREKTLQPILDKIAVQAQELWGTSTTKGPELVKPSPALDFVKWQGPK